MMTELDLKQFIKENELVCKWTMANDLILLLLPHNLTEFTKLANDFFADRTYDCILLSDGTVAVDLFNILPHYNIDPFIITLEGFDDDE